MKNPKTILTVLVLSIVVLFFNECITHSADQETDRRGAAYAGSISCKKCHQAIFESHQHAPHALASQRMDYNYLKLVNDTFLFNPGDIVTAESNDSGWVETEYSNGKKLASAHADIVFGAGKHAYTFGYWRDKKLFQLPLSYFNSIGGWANSPGFPAHQANFNRPIITRCFECHGSFIAEDMEQTGSITAARNLDSSSLITGIDCERCHGPAAAHVQYHEDNPNEKVAKNISRWKSLSRSRRLDACGVCHSGNDQVGQRSTFSFRPGDTLSQFYYPSFETSVQADVHGKQVQLLEESRCFKMSGSMECVTCHDPHEASQQPVQFYASKCLSCHKAVIHKTTAAASSQLISTNCIDCHMPFQDSKAIKFLASGEEAVRSYRLRTHDIAVYAR